MLDLKIASPYVATEVQLLGGMVGPARFTLGDRSVWPFAIGPWAGEAEADQLPGILQRLRGEWPCVPFGIAGSADLPAGWRPSVVHEPDVNPHGHGSNSIWNLIEHNSDSILLEIAYPLDHPISRLERRITASANDPRLCFELTIEVRTDCRLPIGIHPTFALPGDVGDNRLVLDPTARCWTPPAPAEPGISRMALGIVDAPANAIPLRDGTTLDATRLPLPFATEELLLATHANGHARLECPSAGYAACIEWDPEIFASCMLWMSNRGRTAYPWNGRFLALGIEPVTAAFDLGTAISSNPSNPLAARGNPTSRAFTAGERMVTRYAISVEALA